ncbi:MAG: thiamine-phosphate kinase, partial [Planctomycetota bacterium]
AVLEGDGPLVVTTDLLVEGTHFDGADDPALVGRKALAVSLSDVAAMGCRPAGAVLAVALRPEQSGDWALAFIRGLLDLAEEFDVPLIGGDTTETSGPAALTSTVFGRPPAGGAPILRSGARPGHRLLVTGALGGSLGGRHLTFVPRVEEALALVSIAAPGAMIDLSDGLATDAHHVAAESGVALWIRADAVPVSDAARDAGGDALRRALTDGEDFELLFTLPEEEAGIVAAAGLAGTAVTVVGEVIAGEPGVTLVHPDGSLVPLEAEGYEHFR